VYLNNGVSVNTVVAYKLHLANGATVTYDTNLTDMEISPGPDAGWLINGWREIE
jgi:hypothetical protein